MLNAALIGVLGAVWFYAMYRLYGGVIERTPVKTTEGERHAIRRGF